MINVCFICTTIFYGLTSQGVSQVKVILFEIILHCFLVVTARSQVAQSLQMTLTGYLMRVKKDSTH